MSTWIASVYTVHVIIFPRGSANVDIVTVLLNLNYIQYVLALFSY